MRKSQDALRVCLQSCQVIEIQVPYLKYVIKPMACNLYFVFYSVSKCISWLKHIFQRNLFDHDDPVPPPHLQFFLLGFQQFPRPGPTGAGGRAPCPPPWLRYCTGSYVQCSLLFPELGGVGDPRTEALGRRDERVVLAVLLEVWYATAPPQHNQQPPDSSCMPNNRHVRVADDCARISENCPRSRTEVKPTALPSC